MANIAVIVDWAIRTYTIIVIAQVLVSYFLAPYHPVRRALDRLVEPVLVPIRRVLPRTGMIDFSPLVLVVGLQLLGTLLVNLLR
jgi:YggT family protein